MPDSVVAQIFNHTAAQFDHTGPHFFAYTGQKLVDLVNIPTGSRVLDVATGRGAILLPCARQVGTSGQVIGVDVSDGMLQNLQADVQRSALQQVRLARMDARQLAFSDRTFDAVLCGHAIYYFPDVFGEFKRVLRPGGSVGVTILTPETFGWVFDILAASDHSELDIIAETPDLAADETPFDLDTPHGLKQAMIRAGLIDTHVTETAESFVYADEDAWWQFLWTLGIRGTLEALDSSTLQTVKTQIFEKLQSFKHADGIHFRFGVLYGLGRRP